jgi:hypothetical protein
VPYAPHRYWLCTAVQRYKWSAINSAYNDPAKITWISSVSADRHAADFICPHAANIAACCGRANQKPAVQGDAPQPLRPLRVPGRHPRARRRSGLTCRRHARFGAPATRRSRHRLPSVTIRGGADRTDPIKRVAFEVAGQFRRLVTIERGRTWWCHSTSLLRETR